MSAPQIVGYTLAYLWAFWAVYVLVMGIYRAQLAKRLGPVKSLPDFKHGDTFTLACTYKIDGVPASLTGKTLASQIRTVAGELVPVVQDITQ